MSIRRTSLIATLAMLAGAAALPAQGRLGYAPGAQRYHLVSVITRSQEMAGQKTQFRITNEQQVSVKLAPHGRDTLDFSYTLDSSRITSDPPAQLPDVGKLQGTMVHGSMSPLGKVYTASAMGAPEAGTAKNLVDGMTRFLVTLPKDAKVGSTWTDTTRNSVKAEGNDLDMNTITTSKILGDTTFAGQKAWRVQRTSVLAITGEQNQNGQTMHIDGHGTGASMYYISEAGIYLGSAGSQNMAMSISLPGTGQTVPVNQTVTSKVELMQ